MAAAGETTAQRAHRLLAAADALLAEQRHLIEHGDDAGELAATASRLAPVVTALCALAGDPRFPTEAHARVRALQVRLQTDGADLTIRLKSIATELAALRASERRIGLLAPAYRQPQDAPAESRAFSMQA